MPSFLNKKAVAMRVYASYIAYKTCDRVRDMTRAICKRVSRKDEVKPSFEVLSRPQFYVLLPPVVPARDSVVATPVGKMPAVRVARFREELGGDDDLPTARFRERVDEDDAPTERRR